MEKIKGLQINPQEIRGKGWTGYALDFYSVSRGRRTEIGWLVEQVKYYNDRSKVRPIAETAAKFIREEFAVLGRHVLPDISKIIPIPPSKNRPSQPVPKIAVKIGSLLNLPVSNDLKKVKQTVQLQFRPSVGNKQTTIRGAFDVKSQDLQGHCILLFDDVFASGTTLTEATDVLYNKGRVSRVLVLTLTRTHEDRNDEIKIANAYRNENEQMSIERDYFWFRLFKAHGIGTKSLASIAKILEKKKLSPEILLGNRIDEITQHPELAKYSAKISQEDEEKVLAEFELLKDSAVDIIHPRLSSFPPHLLEIAPVLLIKGQRKLLSSEGVAIVGARNVSDMAIRIARQLASDLANMELNVVSGYAKGVDFEAHFGALSEGGTTTIVLPYGIKELRQKRALKEFDWQRDVLAVSQFAPDVKWLARNAVARNKLICALSRAVVVIESGLERDVQGKMSGTFNTAQTALRMNLPLFVLNPGCFANPPNGNANLIGLGGVRLDPDGAAGTIFNHISAAKRKPHRIEAQSSPKQLEFF